MAEDEIQSIGEVTPREITQEMSESYLDYAMSVIVARALPDVRDGLKPVHRRILYAMHDLGLRAGAKYRKSALVVGDVLGKYHPHGDVPVYDALVRMAQTFSLRYPLVDGQGNFGSMDGDAAAAMRYTEARMARIAGEMLQDIDKETVTWADNYDATRKEPTVLPSRVPQLLLNGSVGIAVGMATNIPPHNLGELIDALLHLIDNRKATVDELISFVKGPDFPTGGAIYNQHDILHAYATGKGPIVMRGTAEIVEDKKGYTIIVSEIPYQVNKATLLESIANLVKTKKLEGIRDIRDESDKDGVRVVIELKGEAHPNKILNRLWKLTDLQRTFHVNMLALVDGLQPQVLSLKSMLEEYLKHRKIVIEKRSQYELLRAQERAHILEGLSKALKHINAVIETIKKSATKEGAHAALMKKFSFSDAQASAILEMRLSALAGLEQKKINDELAEKNALIAHLTSLLASEKKLWGVVKDELEEAKKAYGDTRRTKVVSHPVGEISEEDLVPQEEVILTLSKSGFVKRMSPEVWHSQRRGGQGKTGAALAEEDVIEHLISCSSHDDVLFFTSGGKVFRVRAYEIPVSSRTAKGRALVNFLAVGGSEEITAMVPITHTKKGEKPDFAFLVMATARGVIKKTRIEDFSNVRSNGLIAISLKKGDRLGWVKSSRGNDEIMLVSRHGQSIRFSEKDVRPMGRSARGVGGIRLRAADSTSGMDVVSTGKADADRDLLVILERGYGKRTKLKHYKRQRRGGSGIKTARITEKTGEVVSARVLREIEEDLIAISKKGQVIRIPLGDISILGRATQGGRGMKLKTGDVIASITTL